MLIVLGAGASIASPTRLPAFEPMRDELLCALGWLRLPADLGSYRHVVPIGGRSLPLLRSSRLASRGAPPEVVFGALHRFGVPFADHVEECLSGWQLPFNAVHAAAATALHRGARVWSPNVDIAVEQASCELIGTAPNRVIVGERDRLGRRTETDLSGAGPGTFLKLHGSVDAPGSLAFTDVELLAPYTYDEIAILCDGLDGGTVLVYGYAGADADLRDLLHAALQRAAVVHWFEPDPSSRARIQATFGNVVSFDPPVLPDGGHDFSANVAATAEAFLIRAQAEGLLDLIEPGLGDLLGDAKGPLPLGFTLDVPGIVHARLVERFGRAQDVDRALVAARREDLVRVRPRAVRSHLHWIGSRSLYGERGFVGRAVERAAHHPQALRVLPRRLADYVSDKGPARLLASGSFDALHRLTMASLERPSRRTPLRRGSDLYYLGHALRYLHQPAGARRALVEARALLVDRRGFSDAERHAGVLLDLGLTAVHQGWFGAAMVDGQDLILGAGRYAIGRWSGWGHWLRALAALYETAIVPGTSVDDAIRVAEEHIRLAEADFADSALERAAGDVHVLKLMCHRLRLAAGTSSVVPVAPPIAGPRQQQDVALVLADIALAQRDDAAADAHLALVEAAPANAVAAAWAQLGRAVLEGRPVDTFAEIEAAATNVGAWWLAAQARLQATGADEVTIESDLGPLRTRRVGHPGVLWLLS